MGFLSRAVLLWLTGLLCGPNTASPTCRGPDKGVVQKSVVYEGGMMNNSESIKTLKRHEDKKTHYARSDSGDVEFSAAFCSRYLSCYDCVLARDPYCVWNPHSAACVNIYDVPIQQLRMLIQSPNRDPDKCSSVSCPSVKDYQLVTVKPGSSAELPCLGHSNLTQVTWKSNDSMVPMDSRFQLIGGNSLLIDNVALEDGGLYECWSVEWDPAARKNFSCILARSVLFLDLAPTTARRPDCHVTDANMAVFFYLVLLPILLLLVYNYYKQHLPAWRRAAP